MLICYSLALPFFKRTLIGDLVFGYGYMLYRAYGVKFLHSLQLITKKQTLEKAGLL